MRNILWKIHRPFEMFCSKQLAARCPDNMWVGDRPRPKKCAEWMFKLVSWLEFKIRPKNHRFSIWRKKQQVPTTGGADK